MSNSASSLLAGKLGSDGCPVAAAAAAYDGTVAQQMNQSASIRLAAEAKKESAQS